MQVQGLPALTQRKVRRSRGDEERLTADVIELDRQLVARAIARSLRHAGWTIDDKRAEGPP
jgi:hypothetical protein